MMEQKKMQANPIPAVDEGWWASVLAEESRYAPAPMIHRAETVHESREDAKIAISEKKPINWEQAKDLYMRDQIIDLTVTGYNRGGLLVEDENMHGFVPFSHLIDLAGKPENLQREHDLEVYVGRKLQLKVIECVAEDGRMVFSERAAQSEPGRRAELFHSLQPGQNVKGVVTNVTDFGVFVDLGGVEGLIHISELSWGRVSHPNQIVNIGETLDVQVLDLAPERCRVALSLKRLQENPWTNAAAAFPVGSILPATVTSVLSFGAFAKLDAGVEGLIHASEIPQADGKSIKDVLSVGSRVDVRVLHVEASHQRMGLSMRLEQ